MSVTLYCPKCGYSNRRDAKFCGQCAMPLSRPADVGPYRSVRGSTLGGAGTEKPSWQTIPVEDIDWTGVRRTETGIFLVIISVFLGPIPYLTYLGSIIGLVGVIMIIIGRKPFGQLHSNLVKLSVAIWVVGFITGIISAVSYASDATTALTSGIGQNAAQQALSTAFNNLEIGLIITTAILGISNVLLTFSLQKTSGRIILLVAYATSLLMGIVVASIIFPQVNIAVAQALATKDITPLNNLQTQSQLLGLLGLIPAAIWAFAYYRVYQRIANREIPDRSTIPAFT